MADGTIEKIPDPEQIRGQLLQLKNAGVESIAICLMHGYRYPQHEKIVGQIAKQIGFHDIRLSHEIAALIKIVPRSETTVLDAYLNPVISSYLQKIEDALGSDSEIKLMTSAGTLAARNMFSGKDSVFSGPAGGVIGAARVAEKCGFSKAIGLDMGGTSTDVARYDGAFEMEFETRKADVKIVTPVLAIETVAAGGGSICRFDGVRQTVGPESAGADPGPACYGAGGPLTMTDVNLFLGRIDSARFPFPLRPAMVEEKLCEIQHELAQAGFQRSLIEIAAGFLKIANFNMTSAIRRVSVAKGFDPAKYLLVAFGGAGGQHACAIAENLGIQNILVHPFSSILSAVGIHLAEHSVSRSVSIMQVLSATTLIEIESFRETAATQLTQQLMKQVDVDDAIRLETTLSLDLRYVGTENSLNIRQPPRPGLQN